MNFMKDNSIALPNGREGCRFASPFGYTHPNDDKRQMCPYCYNEDTQRIIDLVDLKPYQEYHKGKPFMAYSCDCCAGKWHFSETRGDTTSEPQKPAPIRCTDGLERADFQEHPGWRNVKLTDPAAKPKETL